MGEPFTIESDPARGVLRLVLRGFWRSDALVAFAHAVDVASRALPCGLGNQRVIAVLIDWPVQSQDLFAEMIAYLRTAEPKPRRLAMIAAPGLAKLQLRRSLDPGHMAIFDREADAMAWLMAPEAAARAPEG